MDDILSSANEIVVLLTHESVAAKGGVFKRKIQMPVECPELCDPIA